MKSVKFLFYFFLVLLCQNLAAEEVFNGEHTVGSWSAKTLSAENYNVQEGECWRCAGRNRIGS